MKKKILFALYGLTILLGGCNTNNKKTGQTALPIAGTWQLISGTTIEKKDTTVTYYTSNLSFIKIINDTHFAFLKHDLKKGKDSSANFGSGGGSYTLKDSLYTEHLEYCSDREWEGNDFSFTITIKNDTLIQSGIEKVENTGINRLNIEKYARLKN
jgi:hypothetical protein